MEKQREEGATAEGDYPVMFNSGGRRSVHLDHSDASLARTSEQLWPVFRTSPHRAEGVGGGGGEEGKSQACRRER